MKDHKKNLGQFSSLKFFTVDSYFGGMFKTGLPKVHNLAHLGIFRHIGGGSGEAENLPTSKYIGSRCPGSNLADFGPPGAEKLIFSDKTLGCLIDLTPKHMH